jgi:hypothetical protein
MRAETHRVALARSDTEAITIPATATHVFHFIADPQNLPSWAVGFCRAIRRDADTDDRWIVTTPQGEMPIRFATNELLGTIDFHLMPAPGVELVAYSRVVPNLEGAEYVFTQLQAAGMSDDVFEGQIRALIDELQVLRGLIGARAACPA